VAVPGVVVYLTIANRRDNEHGRISLRAALGAEGPDTSTEAPDNKEDATALRGLFAGSSLFWTLQLLPVRHREAMYALYAICREVDDIVDGDASRSLKEILLSNWRSEIAHLYAGRPQHAVTRGLKSARTLPDHTLTFRHIGIVSACSLGAAREPVS